MNVALASSRHAAKMAALQRPKLGPYRQPQVSSSLFLNGLALGYQWTGGSTVTVQQAVLVMKAISEVREIAGSAGRLPG